MKEAQHLAPVWRERADFILGAIVEDGISEQLWARKVDDLQFEVCCIPFWVYNISLGDRRHRRGVQRTTGGQLIRTLRVPRLVSRARFPP
jgi:hypothetical protein